MQHISLVPVFNRKHWEMSWWIELWIGIEQSRKTLSVKPKQKQNSFLFLFVILLWTVSQEQLSITSTFAIQIFLASKLNSRNTCQTYILHFLFAEFPPFTELLSYVSHQIKKTCIHYLPVFTYSAQEMTNHLKIHRLDKINKPVKFVIG